MANISNVPAYNVSRKADEEYKEAQHQHFLAIEAVDYESAERPDKKRCHDIARQHKSYHVLIGGKLCIKIYGQQRSEYVEGKKEQEIAGHHLQVIGVKAVPTSASRMWLIRKHS